MNTPAATYPTFFEFDSTTCKIAPSIVHGGTRHGYGVTVQEGGVTLPLETVDGSDLYQNALVNLNACSTVDAWTVDRIAFVFSLASRRLTVSL